MFTLFITHKKPIYGLGWVGFWVLRVVSMSTIYLGIGREAKSMMLLWARIFKSDMRNTAGGQEVCGTKSAHAEFAWP